MFKKIYLEITNYCNLSCSFCPKITRKKEYITIDNFNIILNKIKKYTNHLYFHVMGEPLLHPNINELIDLANKDFKINITTNGYLINNIKTKNIRQLNISLHSYNQKYNKSLDNYINDIFNKTEELKDNTYINYRLWTNNEYHQEIINKLNTLYQTNITGNKSTKIANNVFLEIEQEFIWPSLENDYYNESGTCYATRDHIAILVDGSIVPCCLDYANITNLGSIYKSELNDIINTDLFIKIKENFKNNKKVEELCKHCNYKKNK